MFRKLQLNFVMTSVVSITFILLVIFCGIFFSMKGMLNAQAYSIMDGIARDEALSPYYNPAVARYFFIKVNKDGKIIGSSSDITISNEEMAECKETVLKRGVANGYIVNRNFKFKFLKVSKDYGSIIVFIDCSVEQDTVKPFLIICASFGLLSLALVFIISFFLANKAIRPIKTSWEKQSAFIADASHELRTPLAVATSTLEIVMENEAETVGSQGKWIGNVQNELYRMNKLVDDLLFLARADAEDEMHKEFFDLSGLLNKIYDVFMPLTQKKGIKLILDNKENITAYGNEFRIKQLITILLDNAIKYTNSGGEIELKLEVGLNLLQLSVRDTGEGIAKEHIGKIFDRFYRVDKSRSRNLGGSGLGLAIAKCIVNEHKGTINVVSEVSEGTEFIVS
ncbi:MAG: ATP-binding protein, partial [Bacillota bacterium]|nr:ATP-binding protein [Bacillota bacterium]